MTLGRPASLGRHRPLPPYTLTPRASLLPIGEQFLLWALRQWRCEIDLWDAEHRLPNGGSDLQHGFELAGLREGLPHFAMVMDTLLCGGARPLQIHPLAEPFVGTDEGILLALFGLAQERLEGQLAACLSVLLPLESGAVASDELRRLARLLNGAGLGCCCGGSRRIH